MNKVTLLTHCLIFMASYTKTADCAAPVITNLPGTGTAIAESSTAVTAVWTVTATDADGDAISYAITGPAGAPFSINSGGLVIYDGTGLDFETNPSYALQVTVTANGDTVGPATLTVPITNVDEIPYWIFNPGATNPPLSVNVDENVASGTVVYTAAAVDPEGAAVNYHVEFVVPGLPLDVTPAYMQFNSATGVLSVLDPPGIDYEVATTGPTPQLEVYIEATDGALTTYPNFDMVLKITINDLAEPPSLINLPATRSLAENNNGGAALYDVDATDPDVPTTLSFTISGGAMFTINAADGVISVASNPGFDFEVTPQYLLAVEVTDGILTATSTLTVDITDVPEPPDIANLPNVAGSVTIPEDTTAFTNIFTVSASDPEGATLTYTIPVPAGAPFTISSGGVVSSIVNPGFDFETTSQYLLTISVSDGVDTTMATLTVDITNVNDVPQIRNLPASLAIPKTSSGAIFSCDLYDEDGDTLSVTLTTNPVSTPGNPFTINAAGVISVSDPPGVDPATQLLWELTVRATDPSAAFDSKILYLTIINDVNKPTIWNLPRTVTISEDVAASTAIYTLQTINLIGGTLLYTMSASPVDGNFNIGAATPASVYARSLFVYGPSPTGGSETDIKLESQPDTYSGVISYINSPTFDFEAIPSYSLTIIVSNGIGTSDAAVLSVVITNKNEVPTIDNLPATTSVPENSVNLALIFTVDASDPDAGTALVSSMTVDPTSGSSKFSLNPLTHELSVVANPSLDAETVNQYRLDISVTDGSLTSVVSTLNVDITDVNEVPTFPASVVTVAIDEERPVGWTLPVSCVATDPDVGDTLTYSIIVAANSDYFTLDTTIGCAVKLAKVFNSEDPISPDSVSIDIKARDVAGLSSNMQLVVTITNVNEHTPTFASATVTVNIDENLPVSTNVVNVSATDLDAGLPGTVAYTINGAAGSTYFKVDSAGRIAVKTPVDYESIQVISFDVIATDSGTPPFSATAAITVNVNNLNDNRPVFTAPYYSFEVDAASGLSTIVGQVRATDADDVAGTLTYIIVGGSSHFSVGANNGDITLSSVIPTGQKYVLYIVAEDGGAPKQTSIATPIRVDSYTCSDVVFIITVTKNSDYFDNVGKNNFVAALAGLFVGKVARIAKVEAVDSVSTKLHVYVLVDDYASTLALFGQAKQYVSVKDALSTASLNDPAGTPVNYFTTSGAFSAFPVTTVSCECCSTTPTTDTTTNWWLDTQEGNATIGVLSVFGGALLTAAVVLFVVSCYKHCRKREPESYGRKPPPTKKPDRVDDLYNRTTYNPSPTDDTLRWLHPAPLFTMPATPPKQVNQESQKSPRIVFAESRASPDGYSKDDSYEEGSTLSVDSFTSNVKIATKN